MHHKARRFIDDNDVVVFVQNIKRNAVFGHIGRVFGRRLRRNDQLVAVGHLHAHARGRLAVDEHGSGLDPLLQSSAAHRRDQSGKNLVETLSREEPFDLVDVRLCCIIHIINKFKRLFGLFADIIAQLIFWLLIGGHEFQ